MASAKNKVIAGEYMGKQIASTFGIISIIMGFNTKNNIPISKETVESYELITDEHRKSAASGITRGLVGGALLGPVGLLAGVTAKNKGIYTVAIQYHDGKQSLVEIDDKIYKSLLKVMF